MSARTSFVTLIVLGAALAAVGCGRKADAERTAAAAPPPAAAQTALATA